jgi:glycosyltransferase involved in cell wall biosynthesis
MHEKINVFHLIPSMDIGGAEKIVLSLRDGCDRGRFDLRIGYWEDRTALLEGRNQGDDHIIRIPLRRVLSAETVRTVYMLLKDFRVDLLQTHLIDADLIGCFASRLAGIPHYVTIHSYPFPDSKRHCIRYKMMSLFNTRFICVSDTVKRYLISNAGIAPEKISVVYNGIDLGRFSIAGNEEQRSRLRKSLGVRPGAKVVGNVSRLIKDKGHRHLLLAAPDILNAHPDTQFLIVGDGELRASLEELAVELGVAGHVIFAGARTDIPELLDLMDIFVFPTFTEAFGICVLEAMAMGRPIVATDDAAIPELIQDGEEGVLIPPGDPARIAQSVVSLMDKPAWAARLSNAAREKVRLFSVEKMLARMEDLYTIDGSRA